MKNKSAVTQQLFSTYIIWKSNLIAQAGNRKILPVISPTYLI
jgi:hypothetical protein